MKSESEIWGRPGYTSVFAEQTLDLNCSLVHHRGQSKEETERITFIIGAAHEKYFS